MDHKRQPRYFLALDLDLALPFFAALFFAILFLLVDAFFFLEDVFFWEAFVAVFFLAVGAFILAAFALVFFFAFFLGDFDLPLDFAELAVLPEPEVLLFLLLFLPPNATSQFSAYFSVEPVFNMVTFEPPD